MRCDESRKERERERERETEREREARYSVEVTAPFTMMIIDGIALFFFNTAFTFILINK